MNHEPARVLTGQEERRWVRLIYLETVVLAVLLVLLLAIVIVGTYFERGRVFTNTGLIVVFAALLAEFTRRVRHAATDRRFAQALETRKERKP